jgi:competence protein ComEC
VREKIPEPQASLGIGFLTGQKSALPDDLSDALKIAGLTHIVVASGYNLTILVRMARKLLLNVSKFLSTVSAVGMIVFFVAITGLSPSMTRAGLVSSMSLMAWYYGRAFHPFVLLPLAAAITVIMQPSYVWGDLGWQLSFAAFAGVMIVAPLVQRYFFGEKEPGVFRQVFGETIAAHLVTVPIIALSFGTISHVAIIANLLVVPLVPLAMLLTFIVGILAIANVPLSMLIAEPASWLLGYMVTVARFVSELEWAQSELTIPSWWWIVYVALIGGMCVWIWKVTRFRFGATEPLY